MTKSLAMKIQNAAVPYRMGRRSRQKAESSFQYDGRPWRICVL